MVQRIPFVGSRISRLPLSSAGCAMSCPRGVAGYICLATEKRMRPNHVFGWWGLGGFLWQLAVHGFLAWFSSRQRVQAAGRPPEYW
jgi:hypothetical protein